MPYIRPTLQEIIDRIVSDIKTRIERAQTFLQKSVFNILAAVIGASEHLLYDFIEYIKDQLFISSADSESLEKYGAEYGIYKNYGEKAAGTTQASGTAGIVIPAQTELQSSSGNIYKTTSAATISIGGIASLSIEAESIGTDYNEITGIILSFVNPISGVNVDTTVLTGGIDGGIDEDTVEDFRIKILNRKKHPPHGGTENDYVAWCLEYSDTITRAWTIPEYMGIGTIALAFVRDGQTNIYPDSSYRTAVENYCISHIDPATGKTVGIPVTAQPGFFVIELSPLTVDFTIMLSPNTGTVQTEVVKKLAELILQNGEPGGSITTSQIYESVTSAIGETKSRIITPATDVAAPVNRLHSLGTIIFEEYV